MGRGDGSKKPKSNPPELPRWAVMAQRFYDQAIVDLEAARENMRPRLYHVTVFYSAQAAEKGVKAAYWHLMAEEPKWTHKSDQLASVVAERVGSIPGNVGQAISELLSLQENARYPSSHIEIPIPAELFDETAAKMAVDQALEILTWVESLLRLPTGKPKRKKSC